MKKIISLEKLGTDVPYSPAVAYNNLLFISGQISVDLNSGKIFHGNIQEQTRLTLENLKIVLEVAGSSLENVVKTTIFLADMDDFRLVNEVYKEYFKEDRPARSCVQVARLPYEVKVEIEAIATI